MNTTTAPDGGSSPTLWTPSTGIAGKPRLALAIEHLVKVMDHLGTSTQLLPRSDCETVVQEIDGRSTRLASELEAIDATKALLGMYPARHVHDSDTYGRALATVFMAAELDFVRRVVDPINGLPSRLKYLPTIAEVNEALAAERTRRSQIRATAAWMIREHDRRKAELEERERWAHLGEDEMERRRAQVAALLGGREPGTGDWTGEGEP